MRFERKNLADLHPAEYNPRKKLTPNDPEYIQIRNSLTEFGYADPIVINADGTIIKGHQRCTVMMDLGYTEAEVNIHDGQITDLLSNTLRYNPETISISYAILQEKRRILALVERTRLMAAVDTLEERTLDYLAVELRTPAYEDSLPLETKRTLIKGTLPFYAKLGTPTAVDWVINAVFGNGGIEEWFEYGGNPHHFRILVSGSYNVFSIERFEEFIRAVNSVKRLTSWLDEVVITITFPPSTLHIGGSMGTAVRMGVPLEPDEYDFRDTLHVGGAFAGQASLPVPEDASQPSATTILRTGGVCTIISNLSRGE